MTLPAKRPIRSFVRREGRMTNAQRTALETLWPQYGLAPDTALNADAAFGRHAALILEIGFGMGDSLAEMALADPASNYIGIEVHRPGVGNLLQKLVANEIKNIRVYCADAVEVLQHCIVDNSLDAVHIFFPDPWHKKRHHKRRLIQPAFVQQLRQKLKPGGRLHLATDWENYAEHMSGVMCHAEGFRSGGDARGVVERPDARPLTKFEKRGERLGHGVWDLIFIKI